MANFTDPKSGKQYIIETISALSASVAAGNLIDNKRYEFVKVKNIPARAKVGDQAKFHDFTKAETGSIIRDVDRGTVLVPYKKSALKEILVSSVISESFRTQAAFDQVSSSIAANFLPGIAEDFLIGLQLEEFYTASSGQSGSFIGPSTASFETTFDGSSSFSGISTGTGYDLTMDFSDSSFVSNMRIIFNPGGPNNTLTCGTFIPSFKHKFRFIGSDTNNKCLVTSSLTAVGGDFGDAGAVSPPSGSTCGVGIMININGTDDTSGRYSKNLIKGIVAGDADSGSLAQQYQDALPNREYVIYPNGSTVLSESFHYLDNQDTSSLTTSAQVRAAVTGSSTIKTLYFLSGSSNDGGEAGYMFTGSNVWPNSLQSGSDQLGSLLHSDVNLRYTASYGFYCKSGSSGASALVFEASTASFDNAGSNLDLAPGKMMVPRFLSQVKP